MINGKFFTGLPANMLDRSKGLNRQQTNFFWPDDSQNQSAVDSRVKRRTSVQADNKDVYFQRAEQSNSDAENKERFKKEFTKSSIQFSDNVEPTSTRRNNQKLTAPPQQLKQQNVESYVSTRGKPEVFKSKIEFYDFAEDLNNIPKTDKNNKVEVERNTKNSPKLQNKQLPFDPQDEAINFIENDVRNIQIAGPPRRRNTVRENRPLGRRGLASEAPNYSDFSEDYNSPRRLPLPLPQPPVRNRYPESNPDFEEFHHRRSVVNPRPANFANNYIDSLSGRSRQQFHDDETVSMKKTGRQVHFSERNPTAGNLSHDNNDMGTPPQQMTRKVDNEPRMIPIELPPSPTSPTAGEASRNHWTSNICFSDSESATTPTPPSQPKRNIRNSAINRVSVGLPD